MVCQEVDKLLAGYVNQSLKPRETIQVEEHLKDCEHCRQKVENYIHAAVN
jgi:predicted anti-sigma-YlaC factor YlaD